MMKSCIVIIALTAFLMAPAAYAELVVSANDGKQLEPGQGIESRAPDSVAVIEFNGSRPRVIGSVEAPASIIGPPVSVAVAPDRSFALVTSIQKVDPKNPAKLISDDLVSVIDLKSPAHPTVSQQLHAGLGAAGVVINRAGTLALVANADEGSVSLFLIANGKVIPGDKMPLDAARPYSVNFLPDGRTALVLCRGTDFSRIIRLTVHGSHLVKDGEITLNVHGAGIAIPVRGGHFAIVNGSVASTGEAQQSLSSQPSHYVAEVSLVDLSSGKTVASADLGGTAEYIGLSPDGRYLEATITNGSHSAPTTPGFHNFGLVRVFRVGRTTITFVAEARTGRWCQGAIWSKDNRLFLLQCPIDKEIDLFRLNGNSLAQDTSGTLKFSAGPGGIATATSHL